MEPLKWLENKSISRTYATSSVVLFALLTFAHYRYYKQVLIDRKIETENAITEYFDNMTIEERMNFWRKSRKEKKILLHQLTEKSHSSWFRHP